ncbi:hypothetical protein ACIA8H_35250 [Streptomyces goshikiensis]|uniref:hypothetical protein n=1 Tax=Streptomyces goshikiensis TaxID=1942 RepID=UPI00379F943E
MSAPTPAGPQPEDQPPAFSQPSPALIACADRGYARFLSGTLPGPGGSDHDQGDDAAGTR